MKNVFAAATLVVLLALRTTHVHASVPEYINYQGKLIGVDSKELTGIHDKVMRFGIWDDPTDGIEVWGPQIFDGATGEGHGPLVHVVEGYFNVILGPYDTKAPARLLGNAFTGSELYLEITVVDGEPPAPRVLEPRQKILSVPYAMNAAGGVPVGGIVPFFGNEADLPENWKVCNGSVVSDPDSPLKGVTLPNLTGSFLRGVESPTYPVGSQGGYDNILAHSHYFSGYDDSVSFPRASGSGYAKAYHPATSAGGFDNSLRDLTAPEGGGYAYDTHGHVEGSAYISNNTYSAGALDNRPRFFSVLFIIRVK